MRQDNDAATWDFLHLREGALASHDFVIANTSKRPMNILGVSTSCGCTASEVKKKQLAPGEATVLTVMFDSKGYTGPVEQYVYVRSDNEEEPVKRFVIKAIVDKDVR